VSGGAYSLFSSYYFLGDLSFLIEAYFDNLFDDSNSGFKFGISFRSNSAKDNFLFNFFDNGGSFY